MMTRCAIAALLGALAAPAFAVTPVEKVITLLEDLKSSVETEGSSEAKVYDEFACFCKDTTLSKSAAILAGRDNIEALSGEIAAKTADKEEKESDLAQRKAAQEALTQELAKTEVQYAQEKAHYEAVAADLSKALSSLQSAIKAMETSKPAALLQLRGDIEESLALAEVLELVPEAKHQAVSSFLQLDPSDPNFKYHSQGIIDLLNQLLTDFNAQKTVLDSEWQKADATFKSTIQSLTDQMSENLANMAQLLLDIERLSGEIAQARESLVNAEGLLSDDQLYLKDLTVVCEVRAKDWDQRSQLRADELKALAGALEILKSKVSGLDTEVNQRALLQQAHAAPAVPEPAPKAPAPVLKVVSQHQAISFLQEAAAASSLRGAASLSTRVPKVVAMLSKEGTRLQSKSLLSLAAALSADPFGKVKTLIQGLVERLLAEATAEATKKGFCDEQLGKANKDRDYRLSDSKQLDVEIQSAELKLIELEEEISLLKDAIAKLQLDLQQATAMRQTEHDENVVAMQKAREGFQAVDEALKILKVFYKQAAKATALVQASPVDEDTAGAGFAGAYQGKQESSKGIIGLLEVIAADFDRTDRTTEAAEKAAHENFVEFDRVSRTDIAGKETKQKLDEEDAESTKNTIVQKMNDLKTAQELLDGALRTIEDLKPTCIDTGMSFEERVAKREEEIAALKNALCLLDADGVEPDCQ